MIVNNLSYQVNGKNIIDDVSFVLSNKNKVGLVGVNGSGKTTLLKILSSKLKDYTGNVNNENETIAYLKQEIESKYNDLSIFEYVKQETRIKKLEEKFNNFLENEVNNSDSSNDMAIFMKSKKLENIVSKFEEEYKNYARKEIEKLESYKVGKYI